MAPHTPHVFTPTRLGEVRGARRFTLPVSMVLTAACVWAGAGERPGVEPSTPWSCPDTHPIKGYLSAESGARVYHLPGGRFYEETSPERCYANDEEARRDGSRPVREPRAPGIPNDRV